MTYEDFKVGDRVKVVNDSHRIIHERVGDTGVVISVSETPPWVTVMFDVGNGNNGWGFNGNRYPEAVSLGIIKAEEYYEDRGKNLPAGILKNLSKASIIQWID